MKKFHISNLKRYLSIVLVIIMLLGLSIDVLATESSPDVIPESLTCDVCGATDSHTSSCATLCTCEGGDSGHAEGCVLFVPVSESELDIELKSTPESVSTSNPDISSIFSAAIHTVYDYSDTPVLLGTDTTLSQWEHDTNRYLKIDISGLIQEANATYKIVVKMQPCLTHATGIAPPNGISYDFVKNPPLDVNTNGSYALEDGSGTITYTLEPGLKIARIPVTLRYDNALWNKLANAALGDGSDPLLSVSFIKVTDGVETVLSTANLANAYTGSAMETNGSTGIYRESRQDISNSTGTITCGYDERVLLSSDQMGSQNYSDGHYYKELLVEVDLPRYTDANGTIHYMKFEDFSFSIQSGTAEYTSKLSADGSKITITAKNIYYSNNRLLRFFLKFPESVKDLDDIQFSGGRLTISRDNAVLVNRSLTITMKTLVAPKITQTAVKGAVNTRNLDIVQRLGTYCLRNTGGSSGEHIVSFEFDTNNTGQIHTTSINLMPDFIQEIITVTYTLVDENGIEYTDADGNNKFTYELPNKHCNQKPADNKLILFYRGMLPEEQRDYYFKTITYSIKSIPENTALYHTGASSASYSAGSFWGYVSTDTPSADLITKVTIESLDPEYPLTLQSNIAVVLDSTMNVPYGLKDPTVSTTKTIKAGESFTIGGTVTVVGYPYSSNSRLSKIQVGVLLPEGVTINEETVTLNNSKVDVIVDKIDTPVNGMYLWVVHFPETLEIGYYSENLGALPSGDSMKFSMMLNTDLNVSSHKLNIDEIVFAAGYEANNASGGTYKYFLIDEPQGYDLNNTGVPDKVAKFSSNKTITIQAAPAQLNVTDGVRKADTTASATSQLDHYADYVIYDLNILCENGGTAEDFFYFVSVPKASESGTDFTTASVVGLELQGPATLTTSGTPLQIQYTTDTGLSYQTAQSSSVNWLTADQITDWSAVTLMKVTLADGFSEITNGSETTISIPMYFAKKNSTNETVEEYDYASYAGMKIRWFSKGYYHYRNGANIFAGDVPTKGATVTLQYTAWEQKEIILTAAKGRQPTGNGAVITAFVSVDVPFKNEQVYTLASVKAKDVILVPSTSSISDRDSNTHFGITVSVNGGAAYDILTDKIETTVGSSPQNSSTELTFTLYNGDALSDIVKERYVEIKLVGNNGVIIPVKIIINREMSLADDAESAIQSGKEYIQVRGNSDQVNISSDSAFTAQFVVPGLIPDNYSTRKLTFSKPASGSSVVMIDWTYSTAPRYYHYTLGENDTDVELTKFTEMGSSSQYQYPTGETPVTERLLFIVDLPDSGTASGGSIGLITYPKQEDPIKTELNYAVTAKRTFSFSCEDSSVELEEAFTLKYATSSSDTADSRYLGRQFSIVISGTGLSSGSKLIVGDSAYYLNSDGLFIFPIGELKAGSCSMALYSSENTTAQLTASLWVSANADASNPMLGDKVSADISISISAKRIPSVKVVKMSDRLITREELDAPVEFAYKTENISNLSVTLEVQVKDGNGYRTTTTVLNTVNGSPSQAGVYTIASNGGTLSLKFSSQTSPDTYRLLIKVSDGTTTLFEVPYNFIVTE